LRVRIADTVFSQYFIQWVMFIIAFANGDCVRNQRGRAAPLTADLVCLIRVSPETFQPLAGDLLGG
jgi:hypothetical protein